MILFIILLAIILLIFVILISNIYVTITYRYQDKNPQLELNIRALYGILKFNFDLLSIKTKNEKLNSEEKVGTDHGTNSSTNQKDKKVEEELQPVSDVEKMVNQLPNLYAMSKGIIKKFKITRFRWTTDFGVGEASQTGTLTGIMWAFKGVVLGIISRYLTLVNYPELVITPNFQRKVLDTYLLCMIQIRVGNAILAGFKIFSFYRKTKAKKAKPLSEAKDVQNNG